MTLFSIIQNYHAARTVEDTCADDEVAHQAAMTAIDLREDVEERLNAMLRPAGVTVTDIMKVFS